MFAVIDTIDYVVVSIVAVVPTHLDPEFYVVTYADGLEIGDEVAPIGMPVLNEEV